MKIYFGDSGESIGKGRYISEAIWAGSQEECKVKMSWGQIETGVANCKAHYEFWKKEVEEE